MKRKDEIKAELEEIAPFLATLKDKKDGFKLPNHHLEQMQNQIFDLLNFQAPNLTARKKINIWDYAWFKPAVAAVFVGIVATSIFFWNNNSSLNKTKMADMSNAEMDSYIADNIDDFDVELFIKNNPDLLDETFKDLNAEDIHQYLHESIDDLDIDDIENL